MLLVHGQYTCWLCLFKPYICHTYSIHSPYMCKTYAVHELCTADSAGHTQTTSSILKKGGSRFEPPPIIFFIVFLVWSAYGSFRGLCIAYVQLMYSSRMSYGRLGIAPVRRIYNLPIGSYMSCVCIIPVSVHIGSGLFRFWFFLLISIRNNRFWFWSWVLHLCT